MADELYLRIDHPLLEETDEKSVRCYFQTSWECRVYAEISKSQWTISRGEDTCYVTITEMVTPIDLRGLMRISQH